LFVDIPYGLYGCLVYFDINKKTFQELRKEKVQPGDIIRMVTVNLNNSWTITQMACFKILTKKADWQRNSRRYFAYRKMISFFSYFESNKTKKLKH